MQKNSEPLKTKRLSHSNYLLMDIFQCKPVKPTFGSFEVADSVILQYVVFYISDCSHEL